MRKALVTISQRARAALAAFAWMLLLFSGPQSIADERAEAVAAFERAWQVFTHARCANCHAAGDRPTQGEDGRPHAMAVVRGEDGQGTAGLKCSGCHFDTKLKVAGAPPAVAKWRMPGRERPMIFAGRSAAEGCRQLKDSEQTGMKSLAEALQHMVKDPLVAWSFEPGDDREVPPLERRAFFSELKRWFRLGAPCPD